MADTIRFIASRAPACKTGTEFDLFIGGGRGRSLGCRGSKTINRNHCFATLGLAVHTSARGLGAAARLRSAR